MAKFSSDTKRQSSFSEMTVAAGSPSVIRNDNELVGYFGMAAAEEQLFVQFLN